MIASLVILTKYRKAIYFHVILFFLIFAFDKKFTKFIFSNSFLSNYIAIFVKMLTFLVSKIQNIPNAEFYSCQLNFTVIAKTV